MKDLRKKVEQERTFLKKIELAIPGFRGYRKREDLRIADSLLRNYIARRLEDVEEYAKETREKLAREMLLDEMEEIGKIVNFISKIITEVRHAEQGYMGLVGDYIVREEQLNRLYEFDLKLIDGSNELLEFARKIATINNYSIFHTMMRKFVSKLNMFEETFKKRRDYMLEVFT